MYLFICFDKVSTSKIKILADEENDLELLDRFISFISSFKLTAKAFEDNSFRFTIALKPHVHACCCCCCC